MRMAWVMEEEAAATNLPSSRSALADLGIVAPPY
jgi:hypothetical protein